MSRVVPHHRGIESRPFTERHRALLVFLRDHTAQHGQAPTVKEMAVALGATPFNAEAALAALEARGLVSLGLPSEKRATKLTAAGVIMLLGVG